ncbi:hypothetical protein IC006_0423 [Sulfuracidifex tepidarius]|uniref:Uncharacterized protein n=1 Tax=Sulfuracidifex tepidarius TaxID=1294262 RepID=A0A510E1B8_9CREN|nr:hypothetical protein IC006_0423 [Sulfuracidifex tepidarius]BBG25888.1 hypothetical protein IC007_0393 [Sulfuracidifex tepidarius]
MDDGSSFRRKFCYFGVKGAEDQSLRERKDISYSNILYLYI